MAIVLKTKCEDCVHGYVCQYKNNAKSDMEKLAKTTYGEGPSDDYDWQTMSEVNHVNISFACPHYSNLSEEKGTPSCWTCEYATVSDKTEPCVTCGNYRNFKPRED